MNDLGVVVRTFEAEVLERRGRCTRPASGRRGPSRRSTAWGGGWRSKKIDVRVVAATDRDLRRGVNAGRFRADLYSRLAVIQVRMPALVKRICAERRMAVDVPIPDELTAMRAQHTWPGNVRALRNYLEPRRPRPAAHVSHPWPAR